jgi:hypothetical protein
LGVGWRENYALSIPAAESPRLRILLIGAHPDIPNPVRKGVTHQREPSPIRSSANE